MSWGSRLAILDLTDICPSESPFQFFDARVLLLGIQRRFGIVLGAGTIMFVLRLEAHGGASNPLFRISHDILSSAFANIPEQSSVQHPLAGRKIGYSLLM